MMMAAIFGTIFFFVLVAPVPTDALDCHYGNILSGESRQSCEADAARLNAIGSTSIYCIYSVYVYGGSGGDGLARSFLLVSASYESQPILEEVSSRDAESCNADAARLNTEIGSTSIECRTESFYFGHLQFLYIKKTRQCEEVAKRLNGKFLSPPRTDCPKEAPPSSSTGACTCDGGQGFTLRALNAPTSKCECERVGCQEGAARYISRTTISRIDCPKEAPVSNSTGACTCDEGQGFAKVALDDTVTSCVQSDTAAAKEESKGYGTFYAAAAATVVPTFLGIAAVGSWKLGPVAGTTIAVLVSSRIFDMETDWALYALSLQNPTLDRKMCGFNVTLTDETVCDATDHLRTSALAFSIVSSIGLIPHLLTLYTRVATYLEPGAEISQASLERDAGLLTCIIVLEDIPQIIISAIYVSHMGFGDDDGIGIVSLVISAISLVFAFGDCIGTRMQLD